MNTIAQFFIAGVPVAQPRPRAAAIAGRARIYNPDTARDWKAIVGITALTKMPRDVTTDQPLGITLEFHLPRPKSHYRTGKHADQLKPGAAVWHTQKPDCDNLAKAVLDALTAAAVVPDDRIFAVCHVSKIWADRGREGCHVTINELD